MKLQKELVAAPRPRRQMSLPHLNRHRFLFVPAIWEAQLKLPSSTNPLILELFQLSQQKGNHRCQYDCDHDPHPAVRG